MWKRPEGRALALDIKTLYIVSRLVPKTRLREEGREKERERDKRGFENGWFASADGILLIVSLLAKELI